MTIGRAVATVAVALAAVGAAGCGAGERAADKAGGTQAGVVLQLGAAYASEQPDAPFATYFASQVDRLSKGKLRIDVVFNAGGADDPFAEAHVARLVRSGHFDLGWTGVGGWDELGVSSFQALQAPFLISSYPLLDRVVKSGLASEMLAGLTSQHVRGLALIPGLLRHPASYNRPFVSLHDFAGARIRVQPSRTADALVRALGAVPVHAEGDGIGASNAFERLDGHEASFINPPVSSVISANVTFFPKVLALVVNDRAYGSLDAEQRRVLERAASRTLAHTADFPLQPALAYEGVLARWYCKHTPGRVAVADDRQMRALVRAAAPVYAQLERDPATRRFIGAIRRMKASLPASPPISVPAGCRRQRQPPPVGAIRAPGLLNGTYHWRLTRAAALAFGSPADAAGTHYPIVNAVVLRDGKAVTIDGFPPMTGTYTISGDRVTFLWREFGYPLTFTYAREAHGALRLRAVRPMDRGDEFVWSGGPWRRVGPPVVTIP